MAGTARRHFRVDANPSPNARPMPTVCRYGRPEHNRPKASPTVKRGTRHWMRPRSSYRCLGRRGGVVAVGQTEGRTASKSLKAARPVQPAARLAVAPAHLRPRTPHGRLMRWRQGSEFVTADRRNAAMGSTATQLGADLASSASSANHQRRRSLLSNGRFSPAAESVLRMPVRSSRRPTLRYEQVAGVDRDQTRTPREADPARAVGSAGGARGRAA